MGWFKSITSTIRVRKLENDVMQLRAEYETFRAETLHELTTTLQRLSKRIQTRTKRTSEEEPELDKPKDPFDAVRKINTNKDLSEETIGF